MRRALAALESARSSLSSLELACLLSSSRARDSHLAAQEVQQQLQRAEERHQREREELRRRMRERAGARSTSAQMLKVREGVGG